MIHTDLFLRLKQSVVMLPEAALTIGDVADMAADPSLVEEIAGVVVVPAKKARGTTLVINALDVIRLIKARHPHVHIHVLGRTETLVSFPVKPLKKWQSGFGFLVVSLILFFGSAMAIMNFHTDVSMPQVHQEIYRIVTGEELTRPWIMQIPYSIGIGLGMLLFFNHLFGRRINNEPTPLEIEMFLYQENVNQYMLANQEQHDLHPDNDRKRGK